jgi:DNA polymerase alpha subunit B
LAPYSEARVKPIANTDLKKFGYKPMAMRLSEVSEVLDDRIDEFTTVFQNEYGSDVTFGSAASQSTSEIIAVGRITCDSLEGKLNTASLMLETSRRMGAGLRVRLNVDSLSSMNCFPGQIVALRGINASGEYFSVKEVLPVPLLPPAASSPPIIESLNERLSGVDIALPLNTLVGAGPYTADGNLDFEPLQELCNKAADELADALILMGPFLDVEHPLLASGDFDIPDIQGIDPDTVNLSTLFRHFISRPLQQLCIAVPNITVILVPSVRDLISRHVSWPQEQLPKKELGLPRQVRMVSNPVTISLNEVVIGLCSHDILYELRKEEALGGRQPAGDLLTRLPKYLIEQRHFSPIFPPTARDGLPKAGAGSHPLGAMIDVSYLKLGEWWNVRPDVLITPSMLPPFVKVSSLRIPCLGLSNYSLTIFIGC